MRILEYLYQRYECGDLDTLEMRCPININNLNLNNKMYKELEDLLNDIDELEDKTVECIVTERDNGENNKRYTVRFVDGGAEFSEE